MIENTHFRNYDTTGLNEGAVAIKVDDKKNQKDIVSNETQSKSGLQASTTPHTRRGSDFLLALMCGIQ